MLKKFNSFLLLMALIGNLSANQDKNIMLRDLDVIKSTFEAKYAPYEWKKTYFGWSLEEEINIAKFKILSLNSLSVKDYQRILHSFFISTCDYHVSDSYFSTESALLPFQVISANGKYFVSGSIPKLIETMKKNDMYRGDTLKIGDEIMMFDSQPIASVIEDLKFNALGNPTSKTAQSLAEMLLTQRFGKKGIIVPKGPISLVIKNAQGITSTIDLEWLYLPEYIKDRSYSSAMAAFGKLETKAVKNDNFKSEPVNPLIEKPKIMINHLAKMLQEDKTALYEKILSKTIAGYQEGDSDLEENFTEADGPRGIKRDDIQFGRKIWEEQPKTAFKAQIYEHPESKKRIGYIRIATFLPSHDTNEVSMMTIRLAQSIRFLERNTDALLIDQVDNPGGFTLYSFAIASMMTNKPLKLPSEKEILTQESIAHAIDMIDYLEDMLSTLPEKPSVYDASNLLIGYPLDKKFVKAQYDNYKFQVSQWEQGQHLTTGAPMHGIEYLTPHPLASYSKPIMVLVNSKDFSCGDLFPCFLQDNKRAVIFGEQTAGAGGSVEGHKYPNSLGIDEFHYTASIATRLNGSVLENLGVTPDVPYELTENDVLNGYQDYIKAVNSSLDKMLR